MLLKHVQVLNEGRQIKNFDCAACDLTGQVLTFYGIVGKSGKCNNNLTFRHVGNSYIEIDRVKRECIVIPEVPNIQLLITW